MRTMPARSAASSSTTKTAIRADGGDKDVRSPECMSNRQCQGARPGGQLPPSRTDPGGSAGPGIGPRFPWISQPKLALSRRPRRPPGWHVGCNSTHRRIRTMANWMAREEALTVGRTVLLGAAWILASACTYLAEDGSVMFPANEAFALELPEHCEATRTSSGYTISCTESEGTGSGDSVA